QLLLLGRLRAGGERNGLLLERLHGRVELRPQLLSLVLKALILFLERRLGRGVARRLLENLLRADERDLEPRLRLRPRLGRRRSGGEQPNPPPHCHHSPHNDLPEKKADPAAAPFARALRLEEIAQLEMQLEGRRGPPELI